MNLPRNLQKKLSSTRGQMLIIFLLLLVVASAIVLSMAARTITDVRISTTTDQSNRAYFAAEAGIEEALKRIDDAGTGAISPTPIPFNFSDLNTTGSAEVANALPGKVFVYPSPVERDGVIQVLLTNNASGDGTGGNPNLYDGMKVYWGNPNNEAGADNKTALEVTVVYRCDSDCTSNGYSGTFGNERYIFNPPNGGGGFCGGITPHASPGLLKADELGTSNTFAYEADLERFIKGTLSCGSNPFNPVPSSTPALLRIRPLYNSDVPIAVESGNALPSQGFKILATGTNSGATRRLQNIRLFGSVDPLFDYALFNGSSSTLQK